MISLKNQFKSSIICLLFILVNINYIVGQVELEQQLKLSKAGNKISFIGNEGSESGYLQFYLDFLDIQNNRGPITFWPGDGMSVSNVLAIRKNGVQAQRLGIGIEPTEAKVHIIGDDEASLNSNGLMMLGRSNNANLIFDNNEIMARSNGSASSLYINRDGGDVVFHGMGSGAFIVHDLPFGDRGNMQYESSTGKFFYDNSSMRYKENISTLKDDWTKILKTRPVTYTRPGVPDRWEYGYVAEEIDSIGLTTMVGYDKDGLPEDVRYDKMIIYLVELLKIHEEKLAYQEIQMTEQNAQIEKLESLLNKRKRREKMKRSFSSFKF